MGGVRIFHFRTTHRIHDNLRSIDRSFSVDVRSLDRACQNSAAGNDDQLVRLCHLRNLHSYGHQGQRRQPIPRVLLLRRDLHCVLHSERMADGGDQREDLNADRQGFQKNVMIYNPISLIQPLQLTILTNYEDIVMVDYRWTGYNCMNIKTSLILLAILLTVSAFLSVDGTSNFLRD